MIPLPRLAPALLLAPAAASQQEITPQERDWTTVAGVVAQAGDEIITMRELQRYVVAKQEQMSEPLTGREELEKLYQESLRTLVLAELEAQAGQNQGYDPAQIDLWVGSTIDRDIRQQGAVTYVDELMANERDPLDVHAESRRELYQVMWRREKLGGQSLMGDRPVQDRWIRPGELRAIYRANENDFNPDLVRLRILSVLIAAVGDLEAARELTEEARARILDGEEFAELVAEMGAEQRDTGGLLPLMDAHRLAHPRVREFALAAEVGELSQIIPDSADPGVLWVFRLEERVDSPERSFEERHIQRALRQLYESKRDDVRLAREHALLGQGSFSWLHPGLSFLRPPAAQGPRPGPTIGAAPPALPAQTAGPNGPSGGGR